jgi:hypothetical protein
VEFTDPLETLRRLTMAKGSSAPKKNVKKPKKAKPPKGAQK